MRTFLALLCLGMLLAQPAASIDLVTFGVVEIIEGITFSQTTRLDFGVLVLNDGTLVVQAQDGGYVDANNLVADATPISQGIFSVESVAGCTLEVDCAAGAQPPGLSLGSFTADWAETDTEGPTPHARTLVADIEVLEIGASLTIDRTVATPTGGTTVELPYTVTVVFQ
jgi:hypothetical protein